MSEPRTTCGVCSDFEIMNETEMAFKRPDKSREAYSSLKEAQTIICSLQNPVNPNVVDHHLANTVSNVFSAAAEMSYTHSETTVMVQIANLIIAGHCALENGYAVVFKCSDCDSLVTNPTDDSQISRLCMKCLWGESEKK